MAANGISTLATKELRQKAKLDLVALKRQGYATIVENTTAYSWPTNFSLGDIKITVNNVDDVYLHFYNSVPAISDLITVGMQVTIDWDGRPGNTVATITSPLIDFPGHDWRAQGLGFLLTIITTTELPGNSEDYNIEALHIPNGTFAGSGSPDTSAPFYRARGTYDITQLPTQYNDNDIIDNPNAGGLVTGRPWIATAAAFTFYEAIGSTVAISTTQYVSGNKIYAESSTYDVPSYQPARVLVNDIEVVNTEERGHTLVILDSAGDTVSITNYDTFETVVESGDGGAPGRLALNSALSGVATGNIVVLVVYDASSFDATLRSTINTSYGSTNSNTWSASRVSHIFIGVKG